MDKPSAGVTGGDVGVIRIHVKALAVYPPGGERLVKCDFVFAVYLFLLQYRFDMSCALRGVLDVIYSMLVPILITRCLYFTMFRSNISCIVFRFNSTLLS